MDLPVAPAESAAPAADRASVGAQAEAPSPEPASPEAAPAEPAPEPVAIVLTPPSDPDRPKRAGWWSRTKAALTGE